MIAWIALFVKSANCHTNAQIAIIVITLVFAKIVITATMFNFVMIVEDAKIALAVVG
jgi:hypothetical protein